ncbi:hypothetical protein VTO73DRAFT_12085 [Trametes versicolor]
MDDDDDKQMLPPNTGRLVYPGILDSQPLCEDDLTASHLIQAYALVQNSTGAQRVKIAQYARLMDLAILSARVFCEAVRSETEETDYERMRRDLDTAHSAAIDTIQEETTPSRRTVLQVDRLADTLFPVLRETLLTDLRPALVTDLQAPLTKEMTAPLAKSMEPLLFDSLLASLLEPLTLGVRERLETTSYGPPHLLPPPSSSASTPGSIRRARELREGFDTIDEAFSRPSGFRMSKDFDTSLDGPADGQPVKRLRSRYSLPR